MATDAADKACDRWRAVATTDSTEGVEGFVDHYDGIASTLGPSRSVVKFVLSGQVPR